MSHPLFIPPTRSSFALRLRGVSLLLGVLVVLTLLQTPGQTALAAPMGTITVNTLSDSNTAGDGFCSLREAITRANAGTASADCPGVTGAPNTITFSVNGTITLAGQLPTITSALIITGNGTANTLIEASATPNTVDWRVFAFNSASALQISNLTLRNGGNDGSDRTGGCLTLLTNGALTLTNTTFSNCVAGSVSTGGGALAATAGGTINISGSTFTNNNFTNGTSGGGAIYINGSTNPASLTITNSTFSNNSLNSSSSGQAGGAISCILCTLNITNTTFDGNSATSAGVTGGTTGGGAVYVNSDQTVDLDTVTFTNNTVSGVTTSDGGALYISSQRAVSLTITNSVFSGNSITGGSTRRGGAISFGNGTLTLTSSRLVSNSASGNGSAIYYTSPLNSSIRQSCITGNGTNAVYDTGAAGTIDATGGGGDANANWWGTQWGPRIPALDGGSAVSNGDAINGNGNTVLGSVLVDVNLTDPGTPGTPPTGEWQTTAPTVAGALCDTFPDPALSDVTLTPASFNVNEGANADFTLTRTGYIAIALPVSVNITLGTGTVAADYTLSGGSVTGQSGSQTVTFPAGQASVTVNFAATEEVDAEADNTLTLTLVDGTDYNLGATTSSTATIPANDTVVTNTNDSGDGSLRQAITNANAFATDDTITFTAGGSIGLTSGFPSLANNGTLMINGGGVVTVTRISGTFSIFIVNSGANVTLNGLTITNGNSGGGNGGAIRNSGTVFLTNSFLYGNQGAFGGSIYSGPGSNLTLINSLLSGNTATYSGGGIRSSGTVLVLNSTFNANHANYGGGLYSDGTLSLTNSIFANATEGSDCNTLGTLTVQNSLIEDGSCGITNGVNGNLTGDPALNPDLTLSSTSPAIDAANVADCPATDRRGESRTADLKCDMGAYEMQYADSDTVSRAVSPSALTTFGPTLVGIQRNGGDDPGAITVVKSLTWQTKPDNTIDAYWSITPSSGTTYDLTLQLCYIPGELNGLNEANLRFWRYSAGAWTQVGPTSLTWTTINGNRCASVSGITGFSAWTLGTINAPTAITLTTLSATPYFSSGWVIGMSVLLFTLLLGGLVFVSVSRREANKS